MDLVIVGFSQLVVMIFAAIGSSATLPFNLVVRDRKHRCRRLRRNARDCAIDEIVRHQVTDAQHGLSTYVFEGIFNVEHA
jgi:hypothetical protein